MASEDLVELTDANFDAEVTKSQVPVLVDFWAEWCMPCLMLAPTLEALAGEYKDRLKVGRLNTDANRQTAMNFGISAIPTVLLFKGGQLVKKFVGLRSKKDYKDEIEAALR